MAFNLYCNATPSVDDYTDAEEQINECRQYTVKNCFAVPMHHILAGNTNPVSGVCNYNRKLYACLEEQIDVKVRLMGTKNDIKWFGKILQRNSKIEVTEFSDLYPNKGTKKFYRAYVEVKKTNVAEVSRE
mgnify:CR=1 FL=1